jgi:hypothetical protein
MAFSSCVADALDERIDVEARFGDLRSEVHANAVARLLGGRLQFDPALRRRFASLSRGTALVLGLSDERSEQHCCQ